MTTMKCSVDAHRQNMHSAYFFLNEKTTCIVVKAYILAACKFSGNSASLVFCYLYIIIVFLNIFNDLEFF